MLRAEECVRNLFKYNDNRKNHGDRIPPRRKN